MDLPFEALAAAIRAGRTAPVYILAGPDGLQQRVVLAALRERVSELGYQVFDGAACSARAVVGALRTPALTAGRVVVVTDARWVSPPRGRGADEEDSTAEEGGAGGDEGPLLAYLDRPSPGAILVLRSLLPPDRRRRLVKRVAEVGEVLLAEPPRDPRPWLDRQAQALGLALPPGLWERLRSRLQGLTCERMLAELEKLAVYGPGLDAAALDALVPPREEETVFSLVEAAIAGDGGRALALAAMLQARGEPVPLLLFLLTRQLRSIVLLRTLLAEGEPLPGAAARLGVSPFVARRLADQGSRWSAAALVRCWQVLWEAEHGLKSGRLEPGAALQHAVLGLVVSAAARP